MFSHQLETEGVNILPAYFIVREVHVTTRAKSPNVVEVQVGTENDVEVATVRHVGGARNDVGGARIEVGGARIVVGGARIEVGGARIDVGGVGATRGSEVGSEMAEINGVVAGKDIATVTKGETEVATETAVKDPEEIDSAIFIIQLILDCHAVRTFLHASGVLKSAAVTAGFVQTSLQQELKLNSKAKKTHIQRSPQTQNTPCIVQRFTGFKLTLCLYHNSTYQMT